MQNRQQRAKQFMPFAALKGYYDEILKKQRITEPKKNLDENEARILSDKLTQIHKGMIVSVTYYNVDTYETIEGIVANIDNIFRTLTIVKTKIRFDDVLEISIY